MFIDMIRNDKVADMKYNADNPDAISKIIKEILNAEPREHHDKEHFFCIGLDTRNVIKYIELVSLGTLNGALTHPREIYRTAIIKSVASIIIVHNHPSGDCEPSADDLTMTKKLRDAGLILSIEVIDHVIIGSNNYSFKGHNLI